MIMGKIENYQNPKHIKTDTTLNSISFLIVTVNAIHARDGTESFDDAFSQQQR